MFLPYYIAEYYQSLAVLGVCGDRSGQSTPMPDLVPKTQEDQVRKHKKISFFSGQATKRGGPPPPKPFRTKHYFSSKEKNEKSEQINNKTIINK